MTRRRSRLPRRTQLRLIEHFAAGTTARTAADLIGVNKNTATLYFHKLRELIAEKVADESPFGGEVEIDESYFGGHRKGKRGRGAAGSTPLSRPTSSGQRCSRSSASVSCRTRW